MTLELRALDAETAAYFGSVLRRAGDEAAKCLCTAAYVRYWEDPSLARLCRDRLLAEGRSDGFLLLDGGAPIGWCQASPRETMPYYRERSRAAEPDDSTFAVTCLLLVPEARGRGLGHRLFTMVLDELARRGVHLVHAFPCRYRADEDLSQGVELPESVPLRAGMTLIEDHPMRPLYGARFPRPG